MHGAKTCSKMKRVTKAAVHGGKYFLFFNGGGPTRKAEVPAGKLSKLSEVKKMMKAFSYYLHQLIMYKAAARLREWSLFFYLLIKAPHI